MNYELTIAQIEGIVKEKKDYLKRQKKYLRKLKDELEVNLKASNVVNSVAAIAQRSAKAFIEEVVSLSMNTVYDDEYKFELVFDTNRGQTTIRPTYIDKDGNQFEDLRQELWKLSEEDKSIIKELNNK